MTLSLSLRGALAPKQSVTIDAGVINVLLFVIPRLDRGIQKRAWRLDAASSLPVRCLSAQQAGTQTGAA